ncbi:MAG: Lrp/AsnC family transcriptional regulator [Anaerolineae bacterium]
MKAYVLIRATVGKTDSVAQALREQEGVVSADIVTGPYDVIAVLEAADVQAIGEIVKQKIHSIPGIERTLTCLAV